MPLLSIDDLSIGFRGPLLLDGVSATIEAGQRIGLLGRNGAGKTTLMRLLDGRLHDSGNISFKPGAKIARLTQSVPRDLAGTVHQVVMAGQEDTGDPETQWQVQHAVDSTLSRMELDPEMEFQTLSSSMKRRVLLARSIASEPDVLLMNRRTISTSRQFCGWKIFFQIGRKLDLYCHDHFFKRLPRESGKLIVESYLTGRVITRLFSSGKRMPLPLRKNRMPCSTSVWPKRKRGYGRESKRDVHAMKAASGHSRPCVLKDPSDARVKAEPR